MDGPLAANSGHQGTGMALAPLAHVLYSRVMKHDPSDPHWTDRDRFVLSNGHVSIMQYAMLFLSGYGLELDDLQRLPPVGLGDTGHPEVGHTAGVEVTTGPARPGFRQRGRHGDRRGQPARPVRCRCASTTTRSSSPATAA